MHPLTLEHFTELLTSHEPPCVSLYQPTHRHHPDNQQDPIRYRNLVKEIESSLLQKYSNGVIKTLIEKFQSLSRDSHFWNHRTEGLAILATREHFRVFELQCTVPELLIVAGSFHTKPLLRAMQSADRYQILAIDRGEVRLFEGNRYAVDEVELTQVPKTVDEALGEELPEPHQTVASYGKGAGGPHSGHGEPAMFHGHGSKPDVVDSRRERFFRMVDRAILEHHSRPSGLPLLLAALPEHHTPFREVSHNPHLLPVGIQRHPESLSLEQFRTEAWQLIEPYYVERLAQLSDQFRVAQSRQLGSDELAKIAHAATAGRVKTLLVEADRQIPGRIDSERGGIEPGNLSDPEVDDVLDDLAEIVLKCKGEVVIVPQERMPVTTGAAAIFRF